jgi:hypothetical protein
MMATNVGNLSLNIGLSTSNLKSDTDAAMAIIDLASLKMQKELAGIGGGELKLAKFTPDPYYVERARQRDQDIRDQIQAEKIAAIESMKVRIAADKAVATQRIIESVRVQQQEARQNKNAWMFGQDRATTFLGAMSASSGGTGGGAMAAGGRGFMGAMAIQQAGFALQDFNSQMVNAKTTAEGFGRGMSAIANNVQMLGMAFGPTGLAITAVGGALLSVAVPALVKWMDTERQAIDLAEKHRKAIRGWLDPQLEAEGLRGRARNTEGVATSATNSANDVIAGEIAKQELINHELAKYARKTTPAEKIRREELLKERKKSNAIIADEERKIAAVAPIYEREQAAKKAKADKDAIEDAKTKRQQDREDQMRDEKAFDDWVKDNKRKVIDDEIRANDDKIRELQDKRDAFGDVENPNGSSSASIRGTGAAASAINRALAGTRSVESDAKKQIKILEDQLKELRKANEKANLRKRDITA